MASSPALSAALALHRAGRLDAAEAAYRKGLAETPEEPALLHGLGVCLSQRGDLTGAEDLIRRAIALRPAEAAYYNSLGNVSAQCGRFSEAEAAFRMAISIDPRLAPASVNLGNTLRQMGRTEESIEAYRSALASRPDDTDTRIQLGTALVEASRVPEAVPWLEETIARDPDSLAGRAAYAQALERAGEVSKAEQQYRILAAQRPEWGEAWNNLGRTLITQGRASEAREVLEQGLLAAPNLPELHYNVGIAWVRADRFDRAAESFERVTLLRPDSADGWKWLGQCRLWVGNAQSAVDCLRRAVALDPQNAELHLALGYALLENADFETGWSEYEWRWRVPGRPPMRAFGAPLWDGRPLKSSETLLLHSEQGFGDAIQFVRYVRVLAQRGQRVIVECQRELWRLFASSLDGTAVVARGDPLPAFAAHCPMLSLPHRLGTTLETVPANVPYLVPQPGARAHWRARLDSLQRGPKVGLVWAGSPTRNSDHLRSLNLRELQPLLAVQGIHWVSLQLGSTEAPPAAPILWHDFTAELGDFADTAALVANLDLVIAVDTAVAHLAGALAVPTWLLLPSVEVWRWMRNRSDSPWYPSLKLFRQTHPGEWQPVIAEVAEALRNPRLGS